MEHDDSMLSSPSSHADEGYDDDNLFPESNDDIVRPQTPQNDHLNAAVSGELSPPRSHPTLATGTTTANNHDATTARSGRQQIDDTEDLSPTAANRTTMPLEEEWRPGQGWKSKKAQEDMQRAWENVVDKDFSLKEFGDVMAHRLTKQ